MKTYEYIFGAGNLPKNIGLDSLTPEQKRQIEEDFCVEFMEVTLKRSTYETNGALAVMFYRRPTEDERDYLGLTPEQMQEFCMQGDLITVNLFGSDYLEPDTQYVDENNLPGIGAWLVRNKIAKRTNRTEHSGFCTYRAYKFNLNDIPAEEEEYENETE